MKGDFGRGRRGRVEVKEPEKGDGLIELGLVSGAVALRGVFGSQGGEGGAFKASAVSSLSIGGGGRGFSFKIEMFDGSGVILEAGYVMLIPETTFNPLAAVPKSNTISSQVTETMCYNEKVP